MVLMSMMLMLVLMLPLVSEVQLETVDVGGARWRPGLVLTGASSHTDTAGDTAASPHYYRLYSDMRD